MDRGFVKLWRKSLVGGMMQNPKLWTFWCWCLLKASYRPHKQLVGFQEVALDPGQFVFGRKKAAEELHLSEQTIRTCATALEKLQNITIKSTNRFSVITICNWSRYQSDDDESNHQNNQQLTNNQPTTNQQLTTNKKEEKDKKKDTTPPVSPQGGKRVCVNEKKSFGEFENVKLTDDELAKLVDDFGEDTITGMITELDLYIGSRKGADRYKSHYLALLNWMKRKGIKPQRPVEPKSSRPRHDPSEAYRKHLLSSHPKENDRFRKLVIAPLSETLNNSAWAAFIKPLAVVGTSNGTITLYHPDPAWVTENYAGVITEQLAASGARATKITITGDVPPEFQEAPP